MYTARMWQNQNLTSKPLLLPNVLYHVESSKYQKTVCIVFAEYTFFIKKMRFFTRDSKIESKIPEANSPPQRVGAYLKGVYFTFPISLAEGNAISHSTGKHALWKQEY